MTMRITVSTIVVKGKVFLNYLTLLTKMITFHLMLTWIFVDKILMNINIICSLQVIIEQLYNSALI